ncbi:tRNA (adenosine(37)-N6)-threonylcarbamoyltransferase complex ATPase subunit type 1 TsaE [Rhizobium sp. Leaf341]|uniref:tRNA (adenosine(37)-N6)-threonylcarbamoyltransferase complex ATPase subunit type 1 TsaE n=1 Tax=Rhizobium sp. Leaf341 TaxID=1736344 RepID=UPI0007134C2B|nr:tRNA (adenosine(37)-N6)-threonylcarbamoyltransferase complex ATPase subunit type 1 TsaE [Rhizobium sp. Leaf341]KQR79381.1 tRNA threonylcarbamoyladenosine biosynthesis protein TsaE [Rhizobium sp. Leaf341]
MTDMLRLPLPDEAATIMLGEDLALALRSGDVVALSGDLGAGKSTLARALIRAIADDPFLEVPSPTFTLVQSYDLRVPVSHFDLYRLGDASEVLELGLDELASNGICLIEWPERADGYLPRESITLALEQDGDGRMAILSGRESTLSRMRRSLSIRSFLDDHGLRGVSRRHLNGDASVRGYERIRRPAGPDLILMDAPRTIPGPILEDGKYYQQIAHLAEDVSAFVAIDLYLRERGFAAPEIRAHDIDSGILLLEDLGTDGILDTEGAPIAERYIETARLLARLHSEPVMNRLPLPEGRVHLVPAFDRAAMKIETRLLLDWFLPHHRGTAATPEERESYGAVWDRLVDQSERGEKHLLLRDVHSPNILWRNDRAGIDRVALIDFQDAMIGPTAYDVASLVQDARVTIMPELGQAILDAYIAERRRLGPFDDATFIEQFHLMAAQRNCKLVGIWVRLMQRDGKPAYMKHMPRTFAYLREALDHPSLAPLDAWLRGAKLL